MILIVSYRLKNIVMDALERRSLDALGPVICSTTWNGRQAAAHSWELETLLTALLFATHYGWQW